MRMLGSLGSDRASMIDTHIHVVPPGLPGVGSLTLRPEGGAADVAARLRDEMTAARFKLPFVFHTGDTYSPNAKVRFAHPLLIDEVAVDHADVRFVLAHAGNPWLIDAAEVVYKNVNVWADLSGLVVGSAEAFAAEERQEMLQEVTAGLRRAFRYAEPPNRFLYGNDWPLGPLTA